MSGTPGGRSRAMGAVSEAPAPSPAGQVGGAGALGEPKEGLADMRIGSRWQAMNESTETERRTAGSFRTGVLSGPDSPSTTDQHEVRGGLNVLKRRTCGIALLLITGVNRM